MNSTNDITWTQIVTALVAAYAAFLSTLTFLSNRKEKIRQIEIVISNGFIENLTNQLSDFMLLITVMNPGYKNAIINTPYLRLPDNKTIVFPHPQTNVSFPYKIEENSNCVIWTEMQILAKTLKSAGFTGKIKIFAEVHDGSGKMYRSKKPWKLDVDHWSVEGRM